MTGYRRSSSQPARVDAGLAEKGLRQDGHAPDFLVSYEIPDKNPGMLSLDFTGVGTTSILWHGQSRHEVYPARNEAACKERISTAVEMMLEQFSPSPVE